MDKVNSISHIGFQSMAERADAEKTKRLEIRKDVIRFRNPFLRSTLGGIVKNDTILLGAETGAGKTQLASEIAEDAAQCGRKVFVFALEADTGEWERRRKFGVVSDYYIAAGGDPSKLDYQDWMLGELPELDEYEDQATAHLKAANKYNNIYTFYKSDIFGIQDFIKKIAVIKREADLVIIDHIHYFDLFSQDHNKELGEIMHQMRHMTQTLNVPAIIIAHLRKLQSGQERKLLPDIADFHGSSELSKVCTRAIMLSPGDWCEEYKGYYTYIKVVKNRWGRSRTTLIGRILYNPASDRYDEELCEFGVEGYDGNFKPLSKRPSWLERQIA